MTLDINGIMGLIGVLIAGATAYFTLKKFPHEKRKLDADAAKAFAEAAKLSEEASRLSAQRAADSTKEFDNYKIMITAKLDSMQCEIDTLKEVIKERDAQIETLGRERDEALTAMQMQMEDVQDWAERLVFQVKSLGGDPVKIRKPKGTK